VLVLCCLRAFSTKGVYRNLQRVHAIAFVLEYGTSEVSVKAFLFCVWEYPFLSEPLLYSCWPVIMNTTLPVGASVILMQTYDHENLFLGNLCYNAANFRLWILPVGASVMPCDNEYLFLSEPLFVILKLTCSYEYLFLSDPLLYSCWLVILNTGSY
jgi:hypothetical protein